MCRNVQMAPPMDALTGPARGRPNIFRKSQKILPNFSGIFANVTLDLPSHPMANVSPPKVPIPVRIQIWWPNYAKIGQSDAELAQTAEGSNAFVAKASEIENF